ncbi:hypothetical protein PTT_16147 [Pyrenophora teres f. teres 0-1]|uniref:RING-type domain-containing protein n=2 Tax=Pyrenophora teres f. teres TaxID=97479 RepID=E3S1N2_PYRTT|nr:hypothetical protein PTT_16147 [Pyrenophora teres f. teres 0-1]CAE6995048.1 zf-RING-2 multi-domain protein [Pyrenophora teres f. teres]
MPLSSSTTPSSPTKNSIDTLEHFKTTKIVPLPTASPDEICCICQEQYDESHEAVTVLVKNCYHRFGQDCLERYLNSKSRQSNTCPQCRQVWYTREPATADLENTLSIDSWIAEDLSPFQARPESRPTTHQIRQTLRQDEAFALGMVNSHLGEALEHLNRVRDILSDGGTYASDIIPVLKTVERQAREIHEGLQHQQDVHVSASSRECSRLLGDIRRLQARIAEADSEFDSDPLDLW